MSAADAACPSCGATLATEGTAVGRRQPEQEVLDGKWAIERKLGQGGMGTVYLARDLELERPVAIKMMATELANNPEVMARFEREARMMARLDHPNLVPVYAVGRREQIPFIVMKFLEGQSLNDFLRDRGRVDIPTLLSLAKQACSGLQFIHQRGVVHRDIKPANIFIAPDGHLTLLDLGVAHDAQSTMTRSGVVVGTPRYMAPEQILAKKVDFRADLYALATVVFEMATGKAVFDANSDFAVMKAHIDEAPPDPLSFAPLPSGLGPVLLRGLAKAPEDRFDSAMAFFAALEAGCQTPVVQRGAQAAPQTNLEPIAVTPVPPPALKATPAPAAAQQPAAPVVARQDPPTPMPRDELAAPAARPRRLYLGLGLLLVGGAVGVGAVSLGGAEVGSKNEPRQPGPTEPTTTAVGPREPAPGPKPDPARPDPAPPDATRTTAPSDPAATAAPDPKPRRDPRAVVAQVDPADDRPATVNLVTLAESEAASAYVDVDGIRKGSTPIRLTMDPGKHTLVLRRDGYEVVTTEISVAPGEQRKLRVDLTPTP